jgi:hypothetical protein
VTAIGQKVIERIGKDRSPFEMMRLFTDLFNNGNTHKLAEQYNISKFDLCLLRQFPDDCVLYVLTIQERLGVYYDKSILANNRIRNVI